MSKQEITHLLEEHGVKVTANRLLVAEALSDAGRPLSLTELEDEIGSMDKSSIFRSLMTFRDNHLVHAIEDMEGTRYELCLSHDHDHDEDTHVHFYCEKCHRTFCLENIHIPPVELPGGYDAWTSNYLIKGICPSCSGKSLA
jgi:Fur family ferric uptake transcriptional regulator